MAADLFRIGQAPHGENYAAVQSVCHRRPQQYGHQFRYLCGAAQRRCRLLALWRHWVRRRSHQRLPPKSSLDVRISGLMARTDQVCRGAACRPVRDGGPLVGPGLSGPHRTCRRVRRRDSGRDCDDVSRQPQLDLWREEMTRANIAERHRLVRVLVEGDKLAANRSRHRHRVQIAALPADLSIRARGR
jgi:hypothetical protein